MHFPKLPFLAIGIVLLCSFVTPLKISPSNPVFSLTISNINSIKGKIRIGFYTMKDGFPEQGKASIIKVMNPEKTGTVTFTFTDVPTGHYSIATFQDLNGDEKINKNFIGYPKEPFGFSNNFKPKLSAPKFNDCEIVFDEAHTSFSITLIN